jgi:RAQPRD family integrative conjugative element protein
MRQRRSPATSMQHRAIAIAALVATFAAGLSAPFPACATDAASERADLAVILRELNLIDRLADDAEASAPQKARYHFDYRRLRGDIGRVRSGIQGYLAPPRAQPRDPVVLSGEYREGSPAP